VTPGHESCWPRGDTKHRPAIGLDLGDLGVACRGLADVKSLSEVEQDSLGCEAGATQQTSQPAARTATPATNESAARRGPALRANAEPSLGHPYLLRPPIRVLSSVVPFAKRRTVTSERATERGDPVQAVQPVVGDYHLGLAGDIECRQTGSLDAPRGSRR